MKISNGTKSHGTPAIANATAEVMENCLNTGNAVLKDAFVLLNACINIAGLISNALLIAVYMKNKQLKTKSNVIIAAMAVASIPLAVTELICSLIHIFGSAKYPSEHLLTAQNCVEVVFGYYIVQAIALMSVHRRFIVSKIQRPSVQTNVRRVKRILVLMMVYTAVISLPLIIEFNAAWLNVTFFIGCVCIDTSSFLYCYRLSHSILASLIPSFVIICTYGYVQKQIKRKSVPRQTSIRNGRIRRADRQSRINIFVILIFYLLFYFPRETMTFLFIVQKELSRQKWLYFAAILMSNLFEQFSSLVHVCTSTRYRLKLRQSFAKTEYSAQTRDSVASFRRLPNRNANESPQAVAVSEKCEKNRCQMVKFAVDGRRRRAEYQRKGSLSINRRCDTDQRYLVRFELESGTVIFGSTKAPERADECREERALELQTSHQSCKIDHPRLVRSYTDSELVVKRTLTDS